MTLENFSYGDTPTAEAVAALVRDVLGRGDEFDVSEYDLSARHDVRPLVVKTLLTYLELEDVLQSTSPFYSEYKFQPQKPSQEILKQFDARRAEFLRSIFRHAVKGTTWFSLDLEKVSETIGQPRNRIVAAITYLEEKGDLVVEAAGVRQGYRLKRQPDRLAGVVRRTQPPLPNREEHDIARLRRVLAYAQTAGCLTSHLLDYFGEKRGDCGHCGRCEGQPHLPLSPARRASPPDGWQWRLHELLSRAETGPSVPAADGPIPLRADLSGDHSGQAPLASALGPDGLDSVSRRADAGDERNGAAAAECVKGSKDKGAKDKGIRTRSQTSSASCV